MFTHSGMFTHSSVHDLVVVVAFMGALFSGYVGIDLVAVEPADSQP